MSDLSRLLDDIYGAPATDPGDEQVDDAPDPTLDWFDEATVALDVPVAAGEPTAEVPAAEAPTATVPVPEVPDAEGPAPVAWQRSDDDILPAGRPAGRWRLRRSSPAAAAGTEVLAPAASPGPAIEDFAAGPQDEAPVAGNALARLRRKRP